jgi:LuxR family maltose regulon positive regulatory protein
MSPAASTPEQVEQARPPEPLLRTKLYIPQVRAGLVPRPALIEKLNAGLARKLTLLSAPAGFGKTTLLSEWIASAGSRLPVAWVSLDSGDNDPIRFGTYVAAALETLEFGLGGDAPDFRPAPAPLTALFTALINHLAEVADDFALVLDDYHLITAPPVHEALIFLVAHQPPPMHLVLASRADPPFPLAQLRACGDLIEVRADDLRFSTAEARAFLKQVGGLDLPAEAVAALDSHTEGWIAGLQLAALALQAARPDQPGVSEFIRSFSGHHRFIVDYLAEQVLHQQPEHIRDFLLNTSILERLSAPLCDAVLDDGGRKTEDARQPPETQSLIRRPSSVVLEELERANLFLTPLDGERRWYRYHHLFADFLRERLRQSQPERWPELHRRAAEWHEKHGLLDEAVGHALAVGDTRQAVRLVEQIAESIWMRGEMMRLLGWLEALPDDLIRSRPRLCVFHAWILNILGRFDAVQARLCDAENTLAQSDLAGEARAVAGGMLQAMSAIVAVMENDSARARELAEQALRELPESNRVWRSVAIRNLGNARLLDGQTEAAEQAFEDALRLSQQADNTYLSLVLLYELGELQIVQGRLHRAAETFRQGLRLAEARGAPGLAMAGALHVGLSEVLREWNDIEGGIEHAVKGIEYGKRGRSLGVRVCGYTRLGLLRQARADPQGAAEAFRQAIRLAPVRRRTSFVPHHEVQARLWWRQGDLAAAAHWTRERGLTPDDAPGYMNEAAHLTLARVCVAQDRLDDALRLLTRLRVAAESAGRTGRLIEILALEAAAQRQRGEGARALTALERALRLAEPEGYVRVFADEGEPVRTLLSDLKSRLEKRARGAEGAGPLLVYADKLLSAFRPQSPSRHPQPPISDLLDPLTDREIQILRLIAAGLSNQAIADEFVVSPSTIQWHVKNLYSKLDVHSRTQAVARARELGLLA